MEKPKLRPIQAFPVEYQGKKAYGIRDPQSLAAGSLVLEPHVFFIVSLFDGNHTLLDIQTEYARRFGDLLFSSQLEDLIESLDRNHFLESENFSQYLEQLTEEFRRAEVRLPSHAGFAYPGEPEALREQIEGFFKSIESEKKGSPPHSRKKKVKGLIAPHIDFQRGGGCFARAYGELKEIKADLFVILGTAHAARKAQFILTDKDFQTPLGRMPAHKELIGRLRKRLGSGLGEEEFLHRGEHSVEFQVIFLQHVLGKRKEVRIVPILCGPLQESLSQGKSPWNIPEVRSFVESLKEELEAYRGEWCMIAGADLSHVGPLFGAPRPVNQGDLIRLEEEDRAMLAMVEKGDGEGFSQNVLKDGDRRNICGYSSIYSLLKTLGTPSGKLLQYSQAADPNGTVTFAAVAFYS